MFKNIEKIFKKPLTSQNSVDYIICGLGNPGKKYENTRHNAGFLTIDYIVNELNIPTNKLKFQSQIYDTSIENHRVLLVKPQTYMNLSGNAVHEIISFYKIPIEKVIIIVDDISLEPGSLRIRRKGSAGGHNGLKDIINKTGSDNFQRIKLGVGAKPQGWDLANWVTSEFTDNENKHLNIAIKNAYESIKLMINGETEVAMNRFNS